MDSRTESTQATALKLIVAIQEQKIVDINALINAGADLTYSHNGKTPLQYAVDASLWQSISAIAAAKKMNDQLADQYIAALIKCAISYNSYSDSPNKSNAIAALLQAGARDATRMSELLWTAINQNDLSLIKALVECGVDLACKNADGKTPMVYAADKSAWSCIEVIAAARPADPQDTYGYSGALLAAAASRKHELVKKLLAVGTKPNSFYVGSNNTALHKAVQNDDVEMISLLLAHKADLAAKNNNGKTPMQIAVEGKRWSCVEAIVKGAATDATDSYHFADALMALARTSKTELFTAVLDGNAPATGLNDNGDTLLHMAITSKKIQFTAKFIKNGVDLAVKNKNGHTAMDYAVASGAWDFVIEIAKNKNTDVQDTYHYGFALAEAVKKNNHDAVEALLKAGALNNSKNTIDLNNILFTAINHASLLVVRHLVTYGADLAAVKNNQTPMEYAVLTHHLWDALKAVAEMKKTDEQDSFRYGSILLEAVKQGRIDVVKVLLEAGAKQTFRDKDDMSPLHLAIANNQTQIVELLLRHDPNLVHVGYRVQNPLTYAEKQGYWQCVNIIAKNAKPGSINGSYYTDAASAAVKAGRPWDEINDLIKAGACNTPDYAATVLNHTITSNRLEIGKRIIESGVVKVDDLSISKMTALHWAAKIDNQDAVRYLLEKGAKTTVLNANNKTALEVAIQHKNWTCAEIILKHDHNDGNDKQMIADLHLETALIEAIKKGRYNLVKLLLEHHAPFDRVSDTFGNVVLYWAVYHYDNNPKILTLLLDSGIDIAVKNKDGKTIYDFARQFGQSGCIDLIKKYDVDVRPNRPVAVYRSEAAKVFTQMSDAVSLEPEDMPAAVDKLSNLSRAILEHDLETLIKRRDELDQPTNIDQMNSLIEFGDSETNREKLNKLIGVIGSLLKYPNNPVPEFTARDMDKTEAQDVHQFLQRKEAMDEYFHAMKRYLLGLQSEIRRSDFIIYVPLLGPVPGTPNQIKRINKQLANLKNKNSKSELFAMYIAIRKILLNIKPNDKRDERTLELYREQLRDAEKIQFNPVKVQKAVAQAVPLTPVSVQVSQLQQKAAEVTLTAPRVYPKLDEQTGAVSYTDILLSLQVNPQGIYPVLSHAEAPVPAVMPVVEAPVIAVPTPIPAAVEPLAPVPVVTKQPEAAAPEVQLPDVPVTPIKVSQVGLHQPAAAQEEKPVKHERRQAILA